MEQQKKSNPKDNQLELSSYKPLQQVQGDFQISQIDQNTYLKQNQSNQFLDDCLKQCCEVFGDCLKQFFIKCLEQIFTDLFEFLNSPQCLLCLFGIFCHYYCTYFQGTISFVFSLYFGFLFYYYSRNPEEYNSCSNQIFIGWSIALSFILFSKCFAKISMILEQKYFSTEKISSNLEFLSEIGCCTCLIGLTFSLSSNFGSLYELALIFCGSLYTLILLYIVYLKYFEKYVPVFENIEHETTNV